MFKILFIKEDDSGMCQLTKAALEALLREAYETGRQEASQDFFQPSIEKNLASKPKQVNWNQYYNNTDTDCTKSPPWLVQPEILCTRTY